MEFDFTFFSAVFLFALSSTITPGPNNVMIMTSGMNFGTRKSLPHMFGIALGFPFMTLAVGVGLGTIFLQYHLLHEVIRLAGILYLLYLSWLIASTSEHTLKKAQSKPLTFFQSALFQWVNPKAWSMATGAIATYTSVSVDIYWQVIAIALIFLSVSFPCVGLWLFFGTRLRQILKQPKHRKIFNISMGILLAVSILPAAVQSINWWIQR